MINYESGDILDWADKVDVIGHQVNCFDVMGGGLALQIVNKWPKIKMRYREIVITQRSLLGTCQIVNAGDCLIANLFGQYDVGGGLQTDYKALYKALNSLKLKMKEYGMTCLALPVNLVCGLAGGDWRIVLAIIEGLFGESDIQVILVKFAPKNKR